MMVREATMTTGIYKRLADHLIARSRRRKAAAQEDMKLPNSDSHGLEEPPPSDKGAAKIAKKAAKAEIKRAKKSAG